MWQILIILPIHSIYKERHTVMKHIKKFSALNETKKADKDEKKESKKELLDRLKKKFDVSHDKDGNTLIEVKSGDDFPYKIVEKSKEEFVLSQSSTERTYIKPKWYRIKLCKTFEEALEAIIKRYNKSCSYMPSRKPI